MDKEEKKSVSALREEEVLKFWKENGIFEKSLEKESPHGDYIFYEGPPTANGKPGIHHLEARAFKDAIPRYKTMRGYHVARKGGWDTHGLPVELQVEKKLGLNSKKAIEEYGIAKFNHECKESVWEYTDLWSKFTDRIGYWVDQENAYVTYHNDYIESVWNVIKEANKKELLYKDYKVVPWCPRCGTTLSTHEIAQGYMDVKDLSLTAKFHLKPGQKYGEGKETKDTAYILAWTTTPWTLPGNVALAVGKKISYTALRIEGVPELYILASARVESVFKDQKIEIVHDDIKGSDLVGLEYEPLYPYLQKTISDTEKPKLEKAFKVYPADFVTTEDGTGVVHTAVMYGVDDFNLGNEIGLPKHHMVGLDGKFLPGADFLEGRFVRDEDVAVDIIKDLAHRGLLFKKEKYEHSYPHCWRCKTALIYYARDSWYLGMSSLRDQLVKENEGINWEPSYIKEGRFGEWLKDIKDWAISRERYWGTPLPVWFCADCKKREVLGSIKDIKDRTKKSGNKYFLMRHGEADSNVREIVSSSFNADIHLTEKGKEQVKEAIKEIKKLGIDYIFTSPIIRAQETTKIISDSLGGSIPVITDNRICEYNVGDFDGKSEIELIKSFTSKLEKFTVPAKGGESFNDVKKRAAEFLEEMESKYKNKNILIVSHGDLTWMMEALNEGMTSKEAIEYSDKEDKYLKNAEIRELNYAPIPHNEVYELDLHKPYIDDVELVCECGGKLERTKEVMDVWLDSGAMPFAQSHYPFEGKDIQYPADFICEAIDQTRGWFYTLHAVGIIMGRGKAYKNVICLGHLLDAKGKKMSKSLGNVIDPWVMIDKYGVDTVRLWMYSVNQPGESKNFDEKTVSELHSKVFNLLYNVLAFYELYRDTEIENVENKKSENILDKWIITRLHELTENTTKQLDDYKLLEPTRSIREFIDDLSTWYLRRSRERIKNGDVEAKQTLYYVLKTLVKLMAPFAPFASEDIWQKLKNKEDVESVHLAEWPTEKHLFKIFNLFEKNNKVIEEMKQVREIVTLGLQARQEAGIPVRQPLVDITLKSYDLDKEYTKIIKEELNIKMVIIDNSMTEEVKINTLITEELKQEGQYRELIRAIQDIRKKNGLNPNDVITLTIGTDEKGQEIINKFNDELKKAVIAKEVIIKENDGQEVKIDETIFKIIIEK
jgi:isoleucyl-tRNA synthetase